MSVWDELEIEINRLRNKQDDLDESMRVVKCELETERDNICYIQRKRNELWDSYGAYAPELESILEEERVYIDNFKIEFNDLEEQIQKEYIREKERIDKEIEGLREKIQNLKNTEERGGMQNGEG